MAMPRASTPSLRNWPEAVPTSVEEARASAPANSAATVRTTAHRHLFAMPLPFDRYLHHGAVSSRLHDGQIDPAARVLAVLVVAVPDAAVRRDAAVARGRRRLKRAHQLPRQGIDLDRRLRRQVVEYQAGAARFDGRIERSPRADL